MSKIDTIQALPANKLIQLYLMASFLYYMHDRSAMEDSEYDEVCKQLVLKYDDIDHQHGYLIDKDSLRAGTAFNLKYDDYPLMVQRASLAWIQRGAVITSSIKTRRRRRVKDPVVTPPVDEQPKRRRRRRS